MTRNREADIDAVAMMRNIRDDLSHKLMQMSHEEQRRYISEQLTSEELEHDSSQARKEPRKRSVV